MTDCIFCRIAQGDIPCERVYEDDDVLAFSDLSPQAPVHVLIIPKRHIQSAQTLTEADDQTLCRLFAAARRIAAEQGLSDNGYRIVTNVGADGGQSVPHLHLHLLGGRTMEWPPG